MENGVAGVGIFFEHFEDGRFVVSQVVENGPAGRESQITVGDALVSVDGIEVWGLSLDQIKILILGEEGSPVELRLVSSSGSTQNGTAYSSTLIRQAIRDNGAAKASGSPATSHASPPTLNAKPDFQPAPSTASPVSFQPAPSNSAHAFQSAPSTSSHVFQPALSTHEVQDESAANRTSSEASAKGVYGSHNSVLKQKRDDVPGTAQNTRVAHQHNQAHEDELVLARFTGATQPDRSPSWTRPGDAGCSVEDTKEKLDLAILEVEKARVTFQRKVEDAYSCLQHHKKAMESQLENDLVKLEQARAQVEEQGRGLLRSVGAVSNPMTRADHNHNIDRTPVLLNVGGKEFITSRRVLAQYPESYFARTFLGSEQVDLPRDSRGRHFVDHNPKRFELVMEFLENKNISSKLSPQDLSVLEADAERFNLKELSDYIRGMKPRQIIAA